MLVGGRCQRKGASESKYPGFEAATGVETTPFFVVEGDTGMAERAGGWIERIERRGWQEFVYVAKSETEYRALGPFPAGFKVVYLGVGGHRTGTGSSFYGFVLSGSGEGSAENYGAGVALLHSVERYAGQPVVCTERLQLTPQPEVWQPMKGWETGAWYVIWMVSTEVTGGVRWFCDVLVERRWHEWRWAPSPAGPMEGEK